MRTEALPVRSASPGRHQPRLSARTARRLTQSGPRLRLAWQEATHRYPTTTLGSRRRRIGMKKVLLWHSCRWPVRLGLVGALLAASGVGSWAIVTEVSLVEKLHGGVIEHSDQAALLAMRNRDAYKEAFTRGDAIFSDLFNAVDGAGANIGDGTRFTRFPRADLVGKDAEGRPMWASHIPTRITGPDTNSCNACHSLPAGDGAGDTSVNVIRDPGRTGNPAKFISRNAPHVFGLGAIQRLAEEMTAKLKGIRDDAQQAACTSGAPVTAALTAKGVSFGSITVGCDGRVDTSAIEGLAGDLIVRPDRK